MAPPRGQEREFELYLDNTVVIFEVTAVHRSPAASPVTFLLVQQSTVTDIHIHSELIRIYDLI